ncbi:MAG: hypothetical protein ACXW31_15890, partial [Thermoanaerobaculia bacterium]
VVPPQLEGLIFRALEKDRTKRYASAREFAQELERVAASLPDTPGAPPPLPPTAEVTDEATRYATRYDGNAETVVSIESKAPAPAVQKTLDRVASAEDLPPSKKRRPWLLYVAAALLALVATAGGWMLTRERPGPPAARPAPTPLTASVVLPVAQGRIAVNAFPWANVTSVRDADSGATIDIGANVVTPAPLDLAPGRYEVTLENPNFPQPITRTVVVASGGNIDLHVTFSDPAAASVPDFGVAE